MDFKDYLIKYTTIPSVFIIDFFEFQTLNTSKHDHVIDLSKLAKWLKATKSTLKETLRRSYILDIDYIIVKTHVSKVGRPSEQILLTIGCFKRLTLRSNTQKADEVRDYYLELEEHLDKYKSHIITALNQRIGVLEYNQKPKFNPKSGVIYVLKNALNQIPISEPTEYRIGKASIFKNRYGSHNSSHPDDMEIMFQYETNDIDRVESCLKVILKPVQYRSRKEFYTVTLDQIKQLLKSCNELKNIIPIPNQKGGNANDYQYHIYFDRSLYLN